METTVFQFQMGTSVYWQTCWKCGVYFGILSDLDKRRRSDGGDLYCPNGHYGSYRETDEDRLKKEIKVKQEELARERNERKFAEVRARLAEEKVLIVGHQNRSLKGVVTRTKNRIAAGKCPCCRRNFGNLARHMKGQHPDYTKE